MRVIFNFLEKWEIPRSRVFFHIVFSFLTVGIWILLAILIEIYIISSRENKNWNSNIKRSELIQSLNSQIDDKKGAIAELFKIKVQFDKSIKSGFDIPFELSTVRLWESREQRSSVTSGTILGKTRTGTVGIGWLDGIGWAASEGVNRGTLASSTSEIISHDFMELDLGILRISKDFVAFIGNQFSRTAFYKDILAINPGYDKGVGLGVVNAERIWLTTFPEELQKRIAVSVIKFAFSRIVSPEPFEAGELLNEFDLNIKQLEGEIVKIQADLDELVKPEGEND